MKMKILDQRIGSGIGIGVDEKGNRHRVIGGDLCYGRTIQVNKRKNNYILLKLDYPEREILIENSDKDGLIEFSKLKEVEGFSKPRKRIYELEGFWFFIPKRIRTEVEYVYSSNLQNYSRFRLSKDWWSPMARAPIISVNYKSILEKTIETKQHFSAYYYCEKDKDFNQGFYADLYVQANIVDEKFQIQLWQIINDGSEVLYAHAMMELNSMNYDHFDLADFCINKNDVHDFLFNKSRLKAEKKYKWLRIDGHFGKEIVIDLTKSFFPYDYLVDEFNSNITRSSNK